MPARSIKGRYQKGAGIGGFGWRARDYLSAVVFVGPALLALILTAVVPLIYAFISSLYNWHFHRPALRRFVGAENYLELLTDSRFLSALSVTLIYTAVCVLATMIFGFVLALLMKQPFPGQNVVRALLTIPMIMTPVVSTLVWKTFFFEADLGLINWLLRELSLRGPAWVARSPYALLTVIIVNVWFMTPFVFLIMDAALSSFPRDVLDAAMIDGANYLQRVIHVILPMLRGTIIFTLIFRLTIDYRQFEIIHVMTGGGPAFDTEALSLWVYNASLRNFRIGYGNAGAILMMVIIAILCLLLLKVGLRGVARRLESL